MNENRPILVKKTHLLFVVTLFLGCLVAFTVQSQSADPVSAADEAAPNWLEPRPLSVVDLISGGLEPSLMANSPLVYQPGLGTLQFVSGAKSGSNVTVNARMLPTQKSNVFCLGQDGVRDQWPVVVPESRMTIRSNGVDITDKLFNVQYFPVGQTQPVRGSADGPARYNEIVLVGNDIQFDSQGRFIMPANMGCKMFFADGAANGGNIEITFEHPNLTQYISVSVVSSFSHDFKSFYSVFPANFGQLTAFNTQMVNVKGGGTFGRHDLVKNTPPANADYVLWTYAPTQLDMYASLSDLQSIKPFPGSGTYRLRDSANNDELSVDWITMAGIPMKMHTQDRDFSPSSLYLNWFNASEYKFMGFELLAMDSQFDNCMNAGTCSESFVREVADKRKPTTFYYLSVQRIAPGLTQVPLCAVGTNWTPSNAGSLCNSGRAVEGEADTSAAESNSIALFKATQADTFVYLPTVFRPVMPEPDNPNAGCPCGWFTGDGRMLEYVLPPGW